MLNQAAQTAKRSPEFSAAYAAIAKRRGKKIATIAIARKLLTHAWHLLAAAQAPGPDAPDIDAATTPHPQTETVTGPPRVFRTANLMLIHAASCRFRYSSWASCGVL